MGRGKQEPKSARFNMFISPTELEAIDEWAWANKIRSKSDAVRRLCQIGLAFDRERREAKHLIRDGMVSTTSAIRALLEEAATLTDEQNVVLRRIAQGLLEGHTAQLAAFQNMVETDSTDRIMIEENEIEDLLKKAAELRKRLRTEPDR